MHLGGRGGLCFSFVPLLDLLEEADLISPFEGVGWVSIHIALPLRLLYFPTKNDEGLFGSDHLLCGSPRQLKVDHQVPVECLPHEVGWHIHHSEARRGDQLLR
jgi:hypothetical protein